MFDRKERKVGIIDTGLYRHDYFEKIVMNFQWIRRFLFDSNKDEKGHGTGMSGIISLVR